MRKISELFYLKDRVAIVTGGAGYLGTAESFALAEAGAKVIVSDIDINGAKKVADEITKSGLYAVAEKIDLSKEESIAGVINNVYERYKEIDILINNGFFGKSMSLDDMSLKDWQCAVDGSINQVFLCTKYAVEKMKIKRKGSIVNIASMYGVVSPDFSIYGKTGWDNPANYGAAKAGVIQFTKYCAAYYAKYGIRVNAVSPGCFAHDFPKNKEFDRLWKRLTDKTMLKRIGMQDEIKGIVLYLASDASSYCTGQNIIIDGGWTAW